MVGAGLLDEEGMLGVLLESGNGLLSREVKRT